MKLVVETGKQTNAGVLSTLGNSFPISNLSTIITSGSHRYVFSTCIFGED